MNGGPRLVTVVPADGRSRRMGTSKPLIELRGRTFLEWIAAGYRGLPLWQLIVVAGAGDEPVAAAAARLGAQVVASGDRDSPMLDSIRLGLAALGPDCRAVFIHPADVPLAGRAAIGELLAALDRPGIQAAVPEHAGRSGHPVLLTRPLADAVAAGASPAAGVSLRDALAEAGPAVARVPVEWPGVLLDCDRPADLPAIQDLAREMDDAS